MCRPEGITGGHCDASACASVGLPLMSTGVGRPKSERPRANLPSPLPHLSAFGAASALQEIQLLQWRWLHLLPDALAFVLPDAPSSRGVAVVRSAGPPSATAPRDAVQRRVPRHGDGAHRGRADWSDCPGEMGTVSCGGAGGVPRARLG